MNINPNVPSGGVVSDKQMYINQKVVGIVNRVGVSSQQMMKELDEYFNSTGAKITSKVIAQCEDQYGLPAEVKQLLQKHVKKE